MSSLMSSLIPQTLDGCSTRVALLLVREAEPAVLEPHELLPCATSLKTAAVALFTSPKTSHWCLSWLDPSLPGSKGVHVPSWCQYSVLRPTLLQIPPLPPFGFTQGWLGLPYNAGVMYPLRSFMALITSTMTFDLFAHPVTHQVAGALSFPMVLSHFLSRFSSHISAFLLLSRPLCGPLSRPLSCLLSRPVFCPVSLSRFSSRLLSIGIDSAVKPQTKVHEASQVGRAIRLHALPLAIFHVPEDLVDITACRR